MGNRTMPVHSRWYVVDGKRKGTGGMDGKKPPAEFGGGN
jgi:hypothetical protein